MTTIVANTRMADALVRRQLSAAVEAIRMVLQADEHSGSRDLRRGLERAERALLDGRLGDAREAVGEIERTLDERAEAAAVRDGMRESEALAADRGIETAKTEHGPSTRDGFRWLVQKGRVTGARRQAGEQYGQLVGRARSDGTRSCLNDNIPGGGDGPGDGRARAVAELRLARGHVLRAVGQRQADRLLWLLNSVAGEGYTLRELAEGDAREARALEADLMTALDMMAVHFGLVRAAA
jgi:hypothetical protein